MTPSGLFGSGTAGTGTILFVLIPTYVDIVFIYHTPCSLTPCSPLVLALALLSQQMRTYHMYSTYVPEPAQKDCRDGSGYQYPTRITRIRTRIFLPVPTSSLLAPAIVIETVGLSFLPTIATPHSRTTHNHHPRYLHLISHNPPTQASNNSPQRPATHTPNNTLHNFPQLPTPPTFGDEDDDGVANLNAPGAPGMSVNVVVQPSSSPDWRRSPGSEGGSIAGRWRGDRCIAAATTAALAPWGRPPPRGARAGVAITASDREDADAICRSMMAPWMIERVERARRRRRGGRIAGRGGVWGQRW